MKNIKVFALSFFVILITASLVVQGCSKGKNNEQAEQSQSQQKKEESSKGFIGQLKQMKKTVEAVKESAEKAKKMAQKGPVEPVHFRELLKVLPEAPEGWKAQENGLKGETARFGEFQYSNVEQVYVSDDGKTKVKVKIMDTAYIQPLTAPYAFASVFERETMDSYTKGIKENDKIGVREFHFKNKRGSTNILYKNRFLIQITVQGTDDDSVLKDWENRIDYKALSDFAEKYNTPIKEETKTK